jgi:exo-1,4-beta-D-glucosaminidase
VGGDVVVPGRATATQSGPDGADRATTLTITNTSSWTIAFPLRADIRRGTSSGQELSGDNELQSSIWQNNDITLFPGDSQTLTVTWNSTDLQGAHAVVSISGWNLAKFDISAFRHIGIRQSQEPRPVTQARFRT